MFIDFFLTLKKYRVPCSLRELLDLINDQPRDIRTALQLFGELLAKHVRFEERELFEQLQSQLLPDELEQLAAYG